MADEFELPRRKVLGAIGGVGIASAGAGLGTSAYFNDTESFEGNSLTAGELDLKVDWQQTYNGPIPNTDSVGVHYVNAHPDDNGDGIRDFSGEGVMYGVNLDDDQLYEYDVTTGAVNSLADAGGTSGVLTSPNGLAFDPDNERLYYTVYQTDDDEEDSELWVYDIPSDTNAMVGTLMERNVSGSWYNGKYYYIPNKTDDLREVTISGGSIDTDTKVTDLTGDSRIYRFGDIAINSSGILYGSTNGTSGSTAELFEYDIPNDSYTNLYTTSSNWSGDPTGLQLAFDETEALYGHSAGSGEFFLIDPSNETVSSVGTLNPPEKFSDTANRILRFDPCEREDPIVPDSYQSDNYPNQQHLIELGDVKPGDRGEITFWLYLCDNPGYVWLTLANFIESSVANPEPEQVAEGDSNDEPNLAENVMVRLWYDEDCDNVYDSGEQQIFGPGTDGSTLTSFGGNNPATLEKAVQVIEGNGGRVPLDGQSPFMGYDVGADDPERDCLPGETGLCIGLEWWIPTEVENEIQGDSVEFDLGFYTEQCRHNDGSGQQS